jgi:hypothetical protein
MDYSHPWQYRSEPDSHHPRVPSCKKKYISAALRESNGQTIAIVRKQVKQISYLKMGTEEKIEVTTNIKSCWPLNVKVIGPLRM